MYFMSPTMFLLRRKRSFLEQRLAKFVQKELKEKSILLTGILTPRELWESMLQKQHCEYHVLYFYGEVSVTEKLTFKLL